MDAAFGETSYVARFFHGHLPVMIRSIRRKRMTGGSRIDGYRPAARSDLQATPSYLYFPATGHGISYDKTALWLTSMERTLGWDSLQRILSTFFQRWKFKHPRPDDFFAVANEVSGHDLTHFFDEVYRKASVFDYCIESVASEEVKTEGYIRKAGDLVYSESGGGEEKLYESRVVVRRLQDGILPVEVLLKFENDEEVRDVWGGHALWKLYRVTKPAKLRYAVVDPHRKLLLDIDYGNNSRILSPKPAFAAGKWASKWMAWLQDYLMTLSFLI
jgi:hypothetical protein